MRSFVVGATGLLVAEYLASVLFLGSVEGAVARLGASVCADDGLLEFVLHYRMGGAGRWRDSATVVIFFAIPPNKVCAALWVKAMVALRSS